MVSASPVFAEMSEESQCEAVSQPSGVKVESTEPEGVRVSWQGRIVLSTVVRVCTGAAATP